MKIVHCIFSFNTGGAETMLIDIANEQVKTQDVTIVIVNDSYQQFLLDQLDKRIRLILMRRPAGSHNPLYVLRLNYILWHLHPDVIHVHSVSLLSLIVKAGRGLFFTVHDLNISAKYSGRATCMFAISDAVKDDMGKRCKCPIVTVPNGIVIEKISQRPGKLFENTLKIVQVARLDADKKGQDILIRALADLRQQGVTNVTVDFIGEGKSLVSLQQLTQKLGVTSQIHFLGLKDRNYIYSHLCTYDLMCHPARYEGFGLTVAEAMAAKLPVLVSNEGGPYEIIGQGKYGFAFKMEDVNDCATQIENIYKNYSLALDKTDAACLHMVKNYSVVNMVKKYLKQYEYAHRI